MYRFVVSQSSANAARHGLIKLLIVRLRCTVFTQIQATVQYGPQSRNARNSTAGFWGVKTGAALFPEIVTGTNSTGATGVLMLETGDARKTVVRNLGVDT